MESDFGEVDLLGGGVVADADARVCGFGGIDGMRVGGTGRGGVIALVGHLAVIGAVLGQIDLVVVVRAGEVGDVDLRDAVCAVQVEVEEAAVVLHRRVCG